MFNLRGIQKAFPAGNIQPTAAKYKGNNEQTLTHIEHQQ